MARKNLTMSNVKFNFMCCHCHMPALLNGPPFRNGNSMEPMAEVSVT